MVKYFLIGLSLLLSGCTIPIDDTSRKSTYMSEPATPIYTKKRINELLQLPPVDGDIIPIAVYKFSDLTGQRKPSDKFADLSTAVTKDLKYF